jgi:hypothetical protein
MTAGYESFYLRAADPAGGGGFWVRYTVRIAPGEDPSGSLWFTWFEPDRAIATKQTSLDVAAGDGARSWIEIGESRIGPGRAVGAIAAATDRPSARWDLTFTGEPLLEHLASGWMYTARLPRTKPVSLHPMARMTGTIVIDGVEHAVDQWPAMVGHNWGSQHAERWIWLHGMGFDDHGDDTWIDVVLGRIKLGPVLLPWIASGAICVDGERTALGGIARIRGTTVQERATGASLGLSGPEGAQVSITVGAQRDRFVGWSYADPDGETHDVANCSIADINVTLRRANLPDLVLRATGTAAYELGMREHDHGIRIQPYPDGPNTRSQ